MDEINPQNYAYIDGANLDKATTQSGWKVDYAKLYVWLKDKFAIDRAYIFIGYVSRYKKLYAKMRRAGFELVFKDIGHVDNQVKGNCDADLVLRLVRDVYENGSDTIVVISSDGDFSSSVLFLKEKRKTPHIISPSKRCSVFLMRTGAPVTYLDELRNNLSLDGWP